MSSNTDHHYRAIAFGAAGIAVLCIMDGVIKHLVQTNNVMVVTFGRYLFGAGFAFAIWLQAGRPRLTFEMWKAHALRGAMIAMAAVSFFWCLKVLPLAELIVIAFVAPLLVPFMANIVLGEKLRPRSLIAVFAGFFGVIVAAAGGDNFSPDNQRLLGIASALFSSVTYALAIVLMRARASKDGAEAVSLLGAIIPGILVSAPAIATGAMPPAHELPAFLALGVLASAGIYLLARAYALAEAQILAPLEFTALIWAALIGFFFFAEIPRPQVWIGGGIIVAACLWGAQKEKEQILTPFAPGATPPGAAE